MTEPYMKPFDSYDFVEIEYKDFKALVPRFSSLPHEMTRIAKESSVRANNELDYFNRCLEVMCNCLAPEKMEQLRSMSVDDVVEVVKRWTVQ